MPELSDGAERRNRPNLQWIPINGCFGRAACAIYDYVNMAFPWAEITLLACGQPDLGVTRLSPRLDDALEPASNAGLDWVGEEDPRIDEVQMSRRMAASATCFPTVWVAGIEQAWVRNLMRVIDALPLAYLVGGISMLSSPIMQRFGDRVAGTLVVRETPLAAPSDEAWNHQKYNSFAEHSAIAMGLRRAATPELAGLIQDALRRRNELAPYARREIYRELSAYLQTEIAPFPAELVEMLSDEQYLINTADVLFRDQRLSRVHG